MRTFLRLASVSLVCTPAMFSLVWMACAQDLMKSPPVSIEIEWDGAPCNSEGLIVARVKNISDKLMLLPRGSGRGFGNVLMVRARSSDSYGSSLNYVHFTPYDWKHMDGSSSVQLDMGEEYAYKIRIEDYFDINAPRDVIQLSSVYEKLVKAGGSLSALYGLSDGGPSGWRRGFFFADPEFYTLISSNHLVCPKVQ